MRDWGESKKDRPVPIVPSGIGPEVGARLTEMDFYNRRVVNISSNITNAFGGRYYEPSPGREILCGVPDRSWAQVRFEAGES